MEDFEQLVDRLSELFATVETFDPSTRATVIELLDGVDTLHRIAIHRWAEAVGPEAVERGHRSHPAVAWLLEAYEVTPAGTPQSRAAGGPPTEVRVELRPRRHA